MSSHSKECERSPRLKIRFVDGIIEAYQTEELRVPYGQCPLVDSAPIPLGPRKMATFLVENLSDSWCVEARLQLGYSNCPDDTFFDAGPWVSFKANGYPGEGIVLSSEDAAEYARVLIKERAGMFISASRTRERYNIDYVVNKGLAPYICSMLIFKRSSELDSFSDASNS